MGDGDDVLSLRDISAVRGSFELADINLEVRPGEVVGYLGHNGAGKSTTFRIVADLLRPRSGVVTFGDLDHRRAERSFKQHVTFLWDQSQVYSSMTVADLLTFTGKLYRRWDAGLVARMCRELHLPLDRKASQLSKGMRTKLGLVQAFGPQPSCVILDEPTSALDAASVEWFWELLDDWVSHRGLGVLVSSHSNEEILSQCHRVIMLSEGRIIDRFEVEEDAEATRKRLVTGLKGGPHGSEPA